METTIEANPSPGFVSPLKMVSSLRPPKFVRIPITLCYIITLSVFLMVLVSYFRIQPVIPLFYSLARPAEQLAPKYWLFFFPAILAVITFGHLGLIYRYHDYERLLLQLFAWTTLGINVLLAFALIRILIIVS